MIFDWTISLGNIITLVGFAGSGLIFLMLMRSDIKLLSYRITAVEEAMKVLIKITTAVAQQDTRISTFDERMSAVSRRLDSHLEWHNDQMRKGHG